MERRLMPKLYEDVGQIGSGGFGTVYRIENRTTKKIYAAKLLKRNKGSHEEVMRLSRLKHPNVVEFHEWFWDENCIVIVMEYCSRGNLKQAIQKVIESNIVFSEFEIWRVGGSICLALEFLHGHGILHRDIKPENILFTNDKTVKLCDFGVSKEVTGQHALTCVGTEEYMAPEVWFHYPYKDKADMWSLGCVLYEMATGSLPFTFNEQIWQKMYHKFVNQQMENIPLGKLIVLFHHQMMMRELQPIPTTFGPDLKQLITKLFMLEPSHRPSAQEVLQLPVVQFIRRIWENRQDIVKSHQIPLQQKEADEQFIDLSQELCVNQRKLFDKLKCIIEEILEHVNYPEVVKAKTFIESFSPFLLEIERQVEQLSIHGQLVSQHLPSMQDNFHNALLQINELLQ